MVGIGPQRVHPEAVRLQIFDFVEHVLGVQPVLGELLQNADPISQRQIRKIDVVVKQGLAFERNVVFKFVLFGFFSFRKEQSPQVGVVILKS